MNKNNWINKNIIEKGIENVIFWIQMSPTHVFEPLGIGFTNSNDKKYWVQCRVCEDRYKLSDGYKITLKPIDDRFASEHFYQSDFVELVQDGYIIPKKNDNDRVEMIESQEYIGCGLNMVTVGYVVIQDED